ncbi:hypothetical protein ABPG74_019215 [Tetrahymena malaccensis]
MKQITFLFFAFYLLLATKAASDDNCDFTVDQLNNQVLKTDTDCKNCFTKDAVMTIQANSNQIISITLTEKETGNQQILKPAQKSLIINSDFMIIDQSSFSFSSAYNFMIQCKTNKINEKLTYKLTFKVKIPDSYQFFDLNNGGTIKIVLNFSYLILGLIFCLLEF